MGGKAWKAGSGQAGGRGTVAENEIKRRQGRTWWQTAQGRVQGEARLPAWHPRDRGAPSPAQCCCPRWAAQACAWPQPASGTQLVTGHPLLAHNAEELPEGQWSVSPPLLHQMPSLRPLTSP